MLKFRCRRRLANLRTDAVSQTGQRGLNSKPLHDANVSSGVTPRIETDGDGTGSPSL